MRDILHPLSTYVSLPFGKKRVLVDQPVAIWSALGDWRALILDIEGSVTITVSGIEVPLTNFSADASPMNADHAA